MCVSIFLSIQFCDAESVFRESSPKNTLAARTVETIGMSGETKKSIVRKQLEKCLKISIYSVQSFEAFLCMSEYKSPLLKCISRTILLAQQNKNNHQQHKNCISRIKKSYKFVAQNVNDWWGKFNVCRAQCIFCIITRIA